MSYELKDTFASLPRTTRGKSTILSGKDKNFLYTNGNSVYIRNIENPAKCDVYTEHSKPTTAAKYSPSGFYIASADVSGKLRIWDTVNIEHVLKNEFQPFAGPVNDLDWSGDSQRIVVGGQGREIFLQAISADTGTTIGDMAGHNKDVNSVAFKPSRPFRIVSGAEDRQICFYHGPPFKFNMCNTEHTNFVNCVRYSSDGNRFVSGGADGRALVFDGKTAEQIGELGSPAHKGGIYALTFSPDNSEVLTVSGDKTAKIWNVEDGSLVVDFTIGTTVNDMQLGCLWQGDTIMTVSLSGYLNYLDRNNPSSPASIIRGHNKPITAIAIDGETLYAADGSGRVCIWNVETGMCVQASGDGHNAQVQAVTFTGSELVTCSFDDTVRFVDAETKAYTGSPVSVGSQPQAIASGADGLLVVACVNEIIVMQNGRQLSTLPVDYEPSSVSIHPGQTDVAVGGAKDSSIHIYSLSNGTLQAMKVLSQTGALSALSYSPDGAYLASGNGNRKVCLYSCPNYESIIREEWTAHTAKVLCVAWSPDSQRIASGSVDSGIIVWNTINKSKIIIDRAHKLSATSAVCWRSNNVVVSAGMDCNIKQWNLKFE